MDNKEAVINKLLWLEGYLASMRAIAPNDCDGSPMELLVDIAKETVWRLRFAIRDNDFNKHFPNEREN